MVASESDIESAFRVGDNDDDDGLSISEAATALEKLSGKSVESSTIEDACSSCGVDQSREMTCDEFKSVVRHLESNGTL